MGPFSGELSDADTRCDRSGGRRGDCGADRPLLPKKRLAGDLTEKKPSLLPEEGMPFKEREALRPCCGVDGPLAASPGASATFLNVMTHSTSSPAKMVCSFHFTNTWMSDGMATMATGGTPHRRRVEQAGGRRQE